MKLYKVEKWVCENDDAKCVADYGTMPESDMKLVVKGYNLDKDLAEFGIEAYSRKRSKTIYVVEERA